MTVILRILGFGWLLLTILVATAAYLIIWTFDGADGAASTLSLNSSGIWSLIGFAGILVPGLVLLALAVWLDRRRGRR